MAVDVVPDGKQGSTPENLVGSDAAVCNRIGSGSMSCGRDEPQDSAAKGWVVVTGASGGIGAVLTEQLAKEGYPVVMACRNLEKARPVQQAVMVRSGNRRVVLYPLDLASLDSVRRFTGRLRSEKMQVAVLLNNAGVMNGGFRLTEDGLEEDLAVNYVGAAALAFGLLPLMDEGSRIVNTVSCTYRIGRGGKELLQPDPHRFRRFSSYGSSKLALLLFTLELASRMARRGIRVNAADPGVVDTGMLTMGRWFDPLADKLFRPLVKTPRQGAATALLLASSPLTAQVTGELWRGEQGRRIPRAVYGHPLRGWLWNETVRLLAAHGIVSGDPIPVDGKAYGCRKAEK